VNTLDHKFQYELIITIVNRGFADQVVDSAKEAGAHGGTVLYARGTSVHEAQKFFGITVEPEKEVVMTLVGVDEKNTIMKAICKGAGLTTAGRGMSFALPVDDVMGSVHLMGPEKG
jgi:nitrogen regulatory protein PII